MKIAILVDGGFYRKRAESKLGPKTPADLFAPIKPDLFEHIDGLYTCDPNFKAVKAK